MQDLIIHLHFEDYYQTINLGKTVKPRLTVGSEDTNDVVIKSRFVERCCMILTRSQGDWCIEDPVRSGIIFNGRNIDKRSLEVGDKFIIASLDKKSVKMYAFVEKASEYEGAYEHYSLPKGLITVGNSTSASISFEDETIDDYGFQIVNENQKYYIDSIKSKKYIDDDQKKCVYVNGKRITNQYELRDQDTIFYGGNSIVFHHDKREKNIDGYMIDDTQVYLSIQGKSLTVNGLDIYIPPSKNIEDDHFEIQSRIYPQINKSQVIIENPRPVESKPSISWLSILLPPALMMTALFVIMPLLNGGSGYGGMMIVFSGIAVITSIVNYIMQINNYHKKNKSRVTDYERLLDERRVVLTKYYEQERDALIRLHGDYISTRDKVMTKDRSLWERSITHEDFLETKLGIGNAKFSTPVEVPTLDVTAIEKDPLVIKAHELKKEFSQIENVPLSINLRRDNVVSLLGKQGEVKYLLRTIINQVVTNHSYEEVKLVFILSEQDQKDLAWVRWLPHTWDDNRQHRFIATKKSDAKQMLSNIHDVIKERMSEDTNLIKKVNVPHFIFIITNREIIQNHPMVSTLVAPNESVGISTIFALKDTDWVPPHAKCEIHMDYQKGELTMNGNRQNTRLFEVEKITAEQMDDFARMMAPIRIKHMASSLGIPNTVSLFDVLGITSLDGLNISDHWQNNKSYRSLKTPIGMKMGQELFYFDIHEKEHGPHGLVAGTTGSGKSETLLSYLVSLSAHYHPHYVGFVIIDYKGGGMANDIEDLPHLLGTITNLDESDIHRALVSIKSELKRRQRLFDKYKLNHIDAYQKLYAQGGASEPLPHLILVVDEFAELKSDQPEFMKEIISAARIGRSLGLHLILATQKPSGVVDEQIWSNSRFKLCLKVSTPEDSREVIKRSDASYITLPGRGYMQIGNDEMFELFQSGYGGLPCNTETDDSSMFRVNLTGTKEKIYPLHKKIISDGETQLKALVKHIYETAEANDIEQLDGPWKLPLKHKYILDTTSMNKNGDLIIPIGQYDDPSNQAQGEYLINLSDLGSTMIYGVSAIGKTTLLQTILNVLIFNYSSKDVNVYVCDFGSRILKIYEDTPHVGAVVLSEEMDRFERLLDYLKQTIVSRKKMFTDNGVTSLEAYNHIPNHSLPQIVMIIDRVEYLREFEDKGYINQLEQLIREGMSYGVCAIGTTSNSTSLSFKLANVFTNNLTFTMTEKAEYNAVFGQSIDILPSNIKGRCLGKLGKRLVELQVYLPEQGESEYEMTQLIKNKIQGIEEDHKAYEILPLHEKIEPTSAIITTDTSGTKINLGVDVHTLEEASIYLHEFGGFLVSGLRKSGKTTLFKTILKDANDMSITIFDNFDGELNEFETKGMYVKDIRNFDESKLTYQENDRQIIFINDFTYFDKMASDSLKQSMAQVIGNAMYNETNVFVSVKNGYTFNYDPLSNLVKGLDTGIVYGHAEQSLQMLGIKVSYDMMKEQLRPGQGYFASVRDNLKIQTYIDKEL